MSAQPKLLTIREVAERAGVCERTVRRWIKAGDLRAIRPGRSGRIVRIDERDWRAFLSEGS